MCTVCRQVLNTMLTNAMVDKPTDLVLVHLVAKCVQLFMGFRKILHRNTPASKQSKFMCIAEQVISHSK